MSEYLSAAAAAMGLPEAIVERSAEARAAETGMSIEDVLEAWAGGEQVATEAPAPETEPEPEPAEETPAADEEPAEEEPAPVPAAAAVQVEEEPTTTAPTRAPVPEQVTPGQAARLPEVVTVPTAGIRERTNFAIPAWLTAVLLIAPLFALFSLGGSATGQCGEATELAVDVVSGEIVNCDGSEFTGQAVGDGGTDFIAMGESIYAGGTVAGVNCASCHGANGQGAGAFPALTGALNTFGACSDHIEWVTLGSQGFRAQGLSTYGDTNKEIAGGMPGHSGSLSAEQIAAVSAFERVRFGGGDAETALVDCGLVEEPGDEESEGEEPGEGGEGEEPDEGGEGEAEASASSSSG